MLRALLSARDIVLVQLKVDGATITVPTIECGHLWLGDVTSELVSGHSLFMKVTGTSVDCSVPHFHIKKGFLISVTGEAALKISDVHFTSTLQLVDGPSGLPNSSSLEGTSASIGSLDMVLSGNDAASDAILKSFEEQIFAHLQAALPVAIVSAADALVSTGGTSALALIDAALANAPVAPPAYPEPQAAKKALNLRGEHLIPKIEHGLLIDELTLPLDFLPPPPPVPISGIANISLVPTSLEVAGLRSLSLVELNRPSPSAPLDEAHSLSLNGRLGHLALSLK